jgi:hypothetical protein
MEWLLHCDGSELPAESLSAAAHTGQLAMCKYLLDKGCPLEARACTWAAQNGHLSTLMWLRECGCQWSGDVVALLSARSGSIDTMAYVLQHAVLAQSSLNFILSDMLRTAGAYGHLAAAQWLRYERGALWPALLFSWIEGEIKLKQWSGEVLAWARAEGCTARESA